MQVFYDDRGHFRPHRGKLRLYKCGGGKSLQCAYRFGGTVLFPDFRVSAGYSSEGTLFRAGESGCAEALSEKDPEDVSGVDAPLFSSGNHPLYPAQHAVSQGSGAVSAGTAADGGAV